MMRRYRSDPEGYNERVLKRSPYWSRQAEIARSIVDYRVTVCYSGNAIGKDYLLGGTVPWWITTRRNALCIVTGVSQTLLGSVTWKEIRRAVEGSPLLRALKLKLSSGVKTSPQVLEVRPGWGALGYSTTTVERAAGQHAPELLAIINEASGVEDEIYDAIDSLKYHRLAVFGNPLRAEGRFVDLIRQADRDARDGVPRHLAVNAIRIPSTESPHAELESSPWGLADRTWLQACYRHYGRHSLWVKSHIEAEIPRVSADTLIPENWLDCAAAVERKPAAPGDPVHTTRRIACDLGEGVGRDSTCVLVRDDRGVLDITSGASIGLAEAAYVIYQKMIAYGVPQDRITFDQLGIGRKFPNYLAKHAILRAQPYAGEARPADDRFTNLRTEAAWKLRDRLDIQLSPDVLNPQRLQVPFHIPPSEHWPRLREELRVLTYELAGRKTKLLNKEDWCEILGHSPDCADALIQSFAFA